MKDHLQYNIDKELFLRLSQGDEEAFREIVSFCHDKFLPVAISLVKSEQGARDALQEVFLKLWLNRAKLADIENPGAWLWVTATNVTTNYVRSQLRHELRVKKLIDTVPETEDVLEELDVRFTQSLIDEAVSKLPAKRKTVFLLSRREGLSRKEIASQLNISENTVRNQLAEAIGSIQDYLRKNGGLVIPVVLLCHYHI